MNILKFSIIVILSLLFASISFSQSDTTKRDVERTPPKKGFVTDSIIYSIPTSMAIQSTGDLIKNYCIKELETIEGFTAMVNNQLSDTIYSDLIWEIINEAKEPTDQLRVAIYKIVMPKPTLWIDEKGIIHQSKIDKQRR